MTDRFAPIAIIGRGCVLPGALDPAALADLTLGARDAIVSVPDDRWILPPERVLASPDQPSGDRAWSDRGGYVTGFDTRFDPQGFGLTPAVVSALDPLFQWTLHVARETLTDAAVDPRSARVGAILGNLSFPTVSMARYAEHVWLDGSAVAPRGPIPDARNVFMSGLPAHLLGSALGLTGPRYCLDAACASSLYAIALACEALHDGRADVMLAGAVNRADDLFIHIGFCALAAMSRTGRSRPFDRDADGLVPAEGCAMVALETLETAIAKGHRVLGVLRGVGLSNDGRARGLLAPSEAGQVRAMRRAWTVAGLHPDTVDYVECHATGTPVGDATEVQSLEAVFGGGRTVPIGSLKANLGHLVTVAGVAGLLKVLAGLEASELPPTPHVDHPLAALEGTSLRVVRTREPWTAREGHPRRAAVSAFGFGGNNAHLIVEEFRGQSLDVARPESLRTRIVAVSLGARVGNGGSVTELTRDIAYGSTRVRARVDGVLSAHADEVTVPLAGLRTPPTDLARSIAQQTLWLVAAREALDPLGNFAPERTGVVVGMRCDAEVARWGARWRLADEADAAGADADWIAKARDQVAPTLDAASVLGTMPNIPANRVNVQYDLGAFGYTVSAEERSGLVALGIAVRALRTGAIDVAVVGATDACAEPVHERALRDVTGDTRPAGDAAVAIVLMRQDDAVAAGHTPLALIDDDAPATLSLGDDGTDLSPLLGRPHAATGLLHVVAGVLSVHHGFVPALHPTESPTPWVGARTVAVTTRSLLGPTERVVISAIGSPVAMDPHQTIEAQGEAPALHLTVHRPLPVIPVIRREAVAARGMPMAPTLSPVDDRADVALATPVTQPTTVAVPLSDAYVQVLARATDLQRQLGEAHRTHLADMAVAHQRFMDLRTQATRLLLTAGGHGGVQSFVRAQTVAETVRVPVASAPTQSIAPSVTTVSSRGLAPTRERPTPKGLTLDRDGLKVHAGGRISEVFGPAFAQQDAYRVQVRMPMEPMLLADRVTGLDATPGVLGRGTVWTETDVSWGGWYLHDGRMAAGVMIETGQADLLLVSYMGIDRLNQGARCYRLLGCELTYHRSPPRPGERLDYDIHIDGHAAQGDVRLMFFHYDCRTDGAPALTVRNGQAGFFTPRELADSAGILWKPEDQSIVPRSSARLDPPPVPCTRKSFSVSDLRAFASGDVYGCFGQGFARTRAHVRTPRIADGRLLFLDTVTVCAPRGGPWGRGYLRAETTVHPDDWYFPGHFLNDPCMPGTLMFEGCLQAMAFYLTALGVTIDRDGWRFEPVPDETYKLLCRGQVTPVSRTLVYDLFVEEFSAGPIPVLYADLLCTVDGLPAFHARRVGLRLVPDWPLTSHPRTFDADARAPTPTHEASPWATHDATATVAVATNGPSAGFRFDHASLLACAWGRPSDAFGPIYQRFDTTRRVPRLPGPPYHFMSRVTRVEGPMGEARAGAKVQVAYEIPPTAWYFKDNGAGTMPMCVLMEAALQPCGWLASYVGCTLLSDDDVLFRNLDGKGTQHAEVVPTSGVLVTHATLTSVSRSGAMTIVGFEVRCFVRDTLVYTLDTVFGFFPPSAFADQPGLPTTPEHRTLFDAPTTSTVDLTVRPDRYTKGTARLASPFLLMLDRVTYLDPTGGRHGLGCLRAEKSVDASAWFFKAHFFQDPVQPGSLGVEAMCQALQFFMLETGLHHGMVSPRFEPIALDQPLAWKYRGQVVPDNHTITCTLEITSVQRDDRGVLSVADASLWVDGKRIYDARGLAMRLVSGVPTQTSTEESVDSSTHPWVLDHCPTWVIPAIPAAWMLHRLMAQATRVTGLAVTTVDDFQVQRWVTVPTDRDKGPSSVRLRVTATPTGDGTVQTVLDVYRDARDPRLSRYEPVATATMTVGAYPDGPEALSALDAQSATDPYADGTLFHGPAFRRLISLRMGERGSSAMLSATEDTAVLLDAALHGIPHDALERWSMEVPAGRVAYPQGIEQAVFYGPAPTAGELRVEARFVGWDGVRARTRIQVIANERVWCALTLAEVLLPKGPIGMAKPIDRVSFLRDRRYVPGVGLSRDVGGTTVLETSDVTASNWLPGTLETVYAVGTGEDLADTIALKEHIARLTHSHPARVRLDSDHRGGVTLHEPFNHRALTVARDKHRVTVADAQPTRVDTTAVRDFWRARMETGPWPGEALFLSLIERFVRRVRVADPEGIEAHRGRSLLFLANHQVGVESVLFGVAVSALNNLPTLTLAKEEHRTSWVGRLLELGFAYPGLRAPKVIAYFDRSNPASLSEVLGELATEVRSVGSNVMIHVEGTRARSSLERVQKMTGALLDMAMALGQSVVPVRFTRGLPRETLAQRLEFPYGMGRQDIHLGAPITAAELAGLTYKSRKDRVIEAINALGDADDEDPLPGDPALAERVAAWETATGAEHPHAVMLTVLSSLTDPGVEIRAMLDGMNTGVLELGDSPKERWLADLARRLYGPHGPRVAKRR